MVDADLLISVHYGVSDPFTEQRQTTVPITNYVPGRTYSFNATSQTNATAFGTGGFATGYGSSLTTGSVTESGRTETTYQTYAYTRTTYIAFIDLRAFDVEAVKRAAATTADDLGPVWTVAIYAADDTSDLRRQVPGLVEAVAPYIGTTTPGRVKLRIP